jgi:hypothetical protein
MVILAASNWPSNAELVKDIASLYLDEDYEMADLTFGRGIWWKKWRPKNLVCHDIRIDGVDFTALPEPDDTYDAVAYDPPFISPGGRKTSTIVDFNDRFGLEAAPKSPAALQKLINGGLFEASRVTKPGGIILCKCCSYVSSGKLWPGVFLTQEYGFSIGLSLLDMFIFLGNKRPQPPGRRQVHARQNYSTMLVFRNPG